MGPPGRKYGMERSTDTNPKSGRPLYESVSRRNVSEENKRYGNDDSAPGNAANARNPTASRGVRTTRTRNAGTSRIGKVRIPMASPSSSAETARSKFRFGLFSDTSAATNDSM